LYKIFEETLFIGKQVIFLPKCRSTNDIASEMLNRGVLSEGSIVITNNQYGGRGQRGNSWYSRAEENLTFSIFIKPSFIRPIDNFYLNIVTSLSIFEVLHDLGLNNLRIKWPNDIVYNNRKLAGILIENSVQLGKIESTIIGMGLNINQIEFDQSLNATSLKIIFGESFDKNALFNSIIHQFEKTYLLLKNTSVERLKERYLTNLYWMNEEHTFKSLKKFRGIITGIDEIGRLKVNIGGRTKPFNFKEIEYIV